MNFNNFNTPEEIFDFFDFEKWKKINQFFTLKYRPVSYSTKESLDAVKIASIIFGSIALCVELIMCIAQQRFVGVATIVSFFAYLPAIFIYFFPYTKNISNYFINKIYGRKFKKYMNEDRLKKFITILSSHQHAPHYMKNINNFNNLVLAFHHNSKDFVDIGFNLMNGFHSNFSEKNREDKNRKILENFHKKPNIDLATTKTSNIKKEDKFLFM